MARLQILELPGDDTAKPFVLVVDESVPQRYVLGPGVAPFRDGWQDLAEKIGARGVIVTPETIDIRANETAAQAEPLLRVGACAGKDEDRRLIEERDELHAEIGLTQGQLHSAALSAIRGKHATIRELTERAEQAEAERDGARMWARHGYEIGQRHCSWSDHGVAPAWLTEGWPPHFGSCEHLTRASRYDEALSRVRNLPTEPDTMDGKQERPDVWLNGYKSGVLTARSAAQPRDDAREHTEER